MKRNGQQVRIQPSMYFLNNLFTAGKKTHTTLKETHLANFLLLHVFHHFFLHIFFLLYKVFIYF